MKKRSAEKRIIGFLWEAAAEMPVRVARGRGHWHAGLAMTPPGRRRVDRADEA